MPAQTRLADANAIGRLKQRDTTLFTGDPSVAASVANRLGWTALANEAEAVMPQVREIAEAARAEGVTDVALLGMGGSSLASLVISRILGGSGPRLHALDTTSPVTVRAKLDALDPATTLYLVSSKSGGTIEPNTLYAIFRAAADAALGREQAGKRFIAITDPGSSLETRAAEEGFRATVSSPADVGGRFSALTVFGLVPAALIGADVDALLERAGDAETRSTDPEFDDNEAAQLAAFMVDAHEQQRDKLTIVSSATYESFGLWVEQLVAESLGKHGSGIVPVVELEHSSPRGFGPDRAIVVVRATGDARLAEWAASQRGLHPVHEIVLDDGLDLGREFVVWEYAVALAGFLMDVNPFDEPNVAEAKAATTRMLEGSERAAEAQSSANGVYLTFVGGLPAPDHHEHSAGTAFAHVTAALDDGDYLTILAYLPDDDALLEPLREAVPHIAEQTGTAVCLELGPRYLHSTGQLHKGGPNTGVFVLITTRDTTDVDVPGESWTLSALHQAQAEGDLATLAAHERRALRLDIEDASPESIEALAQSLLMGSGAVAEAR